MTIEDIIIREQQRLLQEKAKLEQLMHLAPPGTLTLNKNTSNGKVYYKWYVSHNRAGRRENRTYLRRQDKVLARNLAKKTMLQARLKDIDNELKALDAYLKKHQPSCFFSKLMQSPGFAQLIEEEMLKTPPTLSEEIDQWLHAEYETNPRNPEKKIFKTFDGTMVRSKSELVIYTFLKIFNIPFRYECLLLVGGNKLYPDFTIRHPVTGEFFYWEHVGLLEKNEYRYKFIRKMRFYINNGYYPDYNLILTYENNGHPLDEGILMDKFKEFFFMGLEPFK